MNEADWLIVAVLGISALLSLWRGFVREAISLGLWVIAFAVAMSFNQPLAALLQNWITVPALQKVIAFAGLFFSTLIVGGLLAQLISALLKKVGLGLLDRMLGVLFGLLRGCIVVVVAIILLPQLLEVDQQVWWNQSLLIPHFAMLEDWAIKVFSELNNWRLSVLRS